MFHEGIGRLCVEAFVYIVLAKRPTTISELEFLADPDVWKTEFSGSEAGSASVLIRVIMISKKLDSENVPEYVLDYVLYHELCHLMIGFDPNGSKQDRKFCELEDKFEIKDKAVSWLRSNCLTL